MAGCCICRVTVRRAHAPTLTTHARFSRHRAALTCSPSSRTASTAFVAVKSAPSLVASAGSSRGRPPTMMGGRWMPNVANRLDHRPQPRQVRAQRDRPRDDVGTPALHHRDEALDRDRGAEIRRVPALEIEQITERPQPNLVTLDIHAGGDQRSADFGAFVVSTALMLPARKCAERGKSRANAAGDGVCLIGGAAETARFPISLGEGPEPGTGNRERE
jgi:hypothetical protein